ncbi:MAG: pantoate--beta-alanine ligase [Sediminibacterium sp.]|nr:pantoate--beta-alanine ligase [Sediminibacterium sp.]
MKVFTKRHEIEAFLNEQRSQGMEIGFVPTMGALHEGHLSLIAYALQQTDISVCSIFVNPTQFNDKADLERYPRMPEKDLAMLAEAGCQVVFLPEVEEIYPEPDSRRFSFGLLDEVLEGARRPGHFNGVAQVVSIFFDIVKPDRAFFGSKDYQQVMVIKELVRQLQLDIEIVSCPILREADGLAMSSRNMLLTGAERKAATLIPDVLAMSRQMKVKGASIRVIRQSVMNILAKDPLYKLDYFEICDGETLKAMDTWDDAAKPVALIACFVGKIRLIDNLVY